MIRILSSIMGGWLGVVKPDLQDLAEPIVKAAAGGQRVPECGGAAVKRTYRGLSFLSSSLLVEHFVGSHWVLIVFVAGSCAQSFLVEGTA